VPEANLILCEGCGYVLSGLGGGSERCPECGKPVAESKPNLRQPSEWQQKGTMASLVRTTAMVLFRPSRFFRYLAVRQEDAKAARSFAVVHFGVCGVILGMAFYLHAQWYVSMISVLSPRAQLMLIAVLPVLCIIGVLGALYAATEIGGQLTAWEAAYRGLRLPMDVVRRAMHYHSAHYLPVALAALVTTAGFRIWVATGNGALYGTQYLYVLCVEIVVCAAYLFKTYWIGMRNVMYANG